MKSTDLKTISNKELKKLYHLYMGLVSMSVRDNIFLTNIEREMMRRGM